MAIIPSLRWRARSKRRSGTSLTVNEVNGSEFGVNIIPHTKTVTTWGVSKVGDGVNMEIDTLARYVARLADWKA